MENQDDHYYISRVNRGDTEAFRYLVEKYRQMVFTLTHRILGTREEAEDAAQEVFIKCYKGLKSYSQQSAFSTWLYRIAYNHAIDMVKKKNRFRITDDIENVSESAMISNNFPDNLIDHKPVNGILKDAINQLAAQDQVIVMLYYYKDLPLKTIGEVIGIRENNVKIRLHRLRSRLMSILKSKSEITSILNL